MNRLLSLSAALVLSSLASAQSSQPPLVEGQVLVKVRAGSGAGFQAVLAAEVGETTARRAFPHLNPEKVNRVGLDRIQVVAVPAGEERAVAARLAEHESVEWAEINSLEGGVTGATLPDDPSFSTQWALHQASDQDMDVPEAWALRGTTEADSDLVVAVIDTGADFASGQADWQGVLWMNPGEVSDGIDNDGNGLVDDRGGWDYDEDDNLPQAVHSHGVNTGGEIAAITDNGSQVAGVASGVKVMVLKTFSPFGGWPTSGPYAGHLAGAAGILYATDHGAHITNNSWYNGDTPSKVINDAVDYAVDNGVHMVFAAANNGNSLAWPGQHPDVTAVAAIDSSGQRSVWGFQSSNYGEWVDIAAGGTNITTTQNGGGVTTTFGGTSAACPLAVGVACLLLSEDPDLGISDLRQVLVESCVDIDALNPGFEGLLGAGHVNALNGLRLLENHTDLSGGLAGNGQPVLNTWGLTGAGDSFTASVHGAEPSSPALLVFGVAELNLPFFGGTLVPTLDHVAVGATDADGAYQRSFTLANGLPSGPAVWAQAVVVDPGAAQGVSLSNAQLLSGS